MSSANYFHCHKFAKNEIISTLDKQRFEVELLHTGLCMTLPMNSRNSSHIIDKCKMSNLSHGTLPSSSPPRLWWSVLNCLKNSTSALVLHVLICIICCATFANMATMVNGAPTTSATASLSSALNSYSNQRHKTVRSADLHAWNNFTDLQGANLVDLSNEKDAPANDGVDAPGEATNIGFNAESSVMLSGAKANSGCPPTTSSHCLRCNNDGCIKCPMYLITDTRQCVDRCPSGYIDQWSAHTEFMGRVCVSTGYSGPLIAALAGLLGGFLVCLSLLGVAVMLARRRRRRKTIKQKLINEHTMDRADFLRQLNDMRPNAEYFLAMLNDTRRQIRKLYLSGEVSAANSYRPIVRDLAKILILLNRPIELIPAPPLDWNRLYTWSEQALERYKPQVGQLIDFFQAPGNTGTARDDFDVPYHQKGKRGESIFRQNVLHLNGVSNAQTAQKLHLFGSLISLHEFEEPRSSDPFGSSFNTLKSGNLISDLNASSLWLEDEFYKLGFRPQDEITTEL